MTVATRIAALAFTIVGFAAVDARSDTIATREGLETALSNAAGGETLLLQPGDYGVLEISALRFSDTVVIRSASEELATFISIEIKASSNIRIEAVHVAQTTNGARASKIFSISDNSEAITLSDSRINGLVDDDFSGWYGVYVRDGRNIRIVDNYIHDVRVGGVFFGGENILISGNQFDRVGMDSMKLGGNSGVIIENNIGAGRVFPLPGAHLDFIQFQGSATDIVIRGNIFIAETVSNIQGIFLDDGEYDNVLIEQNIIYTGMIRGISVVDGENIVVRHNTVLAVPMIGHNATTIIVPDSGVVEWNIISNEAPQGRDEYNNLTANFRGPGSLYYYGNLFQNPFAGLGATLEDLRPIAGGAVDFETGYGATQRFQELLESASR